MKPKILMLQKISGIYVSIPGPGSQQVAINGIQQMTTGL
jgi:hypothetical protein